MAFWNRYKILKKSIKLNGKSVALDISFSQNKYQELKSIIEKQLSGIREFKKLFNSLLASAFISALINDDYIKLNSAKISEIKLIIDIPEMYMWMWTSQQPWTIHLDVGFILDLIENAKMRTLWRGYGVSDVIQNEMTHLLDRKRIALNSKYLKYEFTIPVIVLNFFSQCRIEGITRLREHENVPLIIHSPQLKNFIQKLQKVVYSLRLGTAITEEEEMFISTLQHNYLDANSEHNAYTIGFNMSVIICLALLIKDGRENDVFIQIEDKSFKINELSRIFDEYGNFIISPIPTKILFKAVAFIEKMDDERFVRVYNISCNILNIPKDKRIINKEDYNLLRNLPKSNLP